MVLPLIGRREECGSLIVLLEEAEQLTFKECVMIREDCNIGYLMRICVFITGKTNAIKSALLLMGAGWGKMKGGNQIDRS